MAKTSSGLISDMAGDIFRASGPQNRKAFKDYNLLLSEPRFTEPEPVGRAVESVSTFGSVPSIVAECLMHSRSRRTVSVCRYITLPYIHNQDSYGGDVYSAGGRSSCHCRAPESNKNRQQLSGSSY